MGGVLLIVLLSLPGHCARLVPLPGGCEWQCVLLSERHAELGRVSAGGTLKLRPLPVCAVDAASLGGQSYLAAAEGVYPVLSGGELGSLAASEAPVRAIAPVGERLALLVGGEEHEGRLRGAQVVLWSPQGGDPVRAGQVRPEWNAFALSGLGRDLLVTVRKPAHFDPAVRRRPFLYRLIDGRLQRVWTGTSFSLPFMEAVLADVAPEPGGEACALEVLPDGRRRIMAYAWTGAMMEGVAATEPGGFGQTLQPVGEAGVGVCERDGGGWRGMVLRMGNPEASCGVSKLEVVLASARLPVAPTAWTMVTVAGGSWLVARLPDGSVRLLALIRALSGSQPDGYNGGSLRQEALRWTGPAADRRSSRWLLPF